jgi:hypothetical protein
MKGKLHYHRNCNLASRNKESFMEGGRRKEEGGRRKEEVNFS